MKQPPIDIIVQEITDNIFHIIIKDQYDLTMTFCRAQEFYESPLKAIRGKKFTMIEFMRMYARHNGYTTFTYPDDWAGFNIPGKVLTEHFRLGIDDPNTYDKVLNDIYFRAKEKVGSDNFYFIGSNGLSESTLDHELCHAFYYLDKNYKKKVNNILKKLDKNVKDTIYKHLIEMGYCKKVLLDELNAYMTIDSKDILNLKFNKSEVKSIKQTSKALKEIFLSYFNENN
jgi:hypothetical protein